jgi:hypothetical protein
LRFISVPFHINISSEGRICLNFLARGYNPSVRAVELIQQIREILLVPDERSPVQLVSFDLFQRNKAEFRRRAIRSSQENAADSPAACLANLEVSDRVPADFVLEELTVTPQWERSAFTGEAIPIEKQMIASSGVIYHRDELREHIASTPNAKCVITGLPLRETAADFR